MALHLVEKADVVITVRCSSSEAEQLLAPMLTDLQAKQVPESRGILLTVDGQQGEWQLADHDSDICRNFEQAGDLIYHFSDRLVFHIADRASSVICLHAAAVAHQGRGMVIPGNSGAGKSSFTAWLVANSFDYLTDELILLSGETLEGVARPLQIKPGGIDAINSILVQPDSIIEGRQANAVFPQSLGGRTATLAEQRLAAFVYPEFRSDANFEFEPINSAEAGMRLMQNHVNARNLEGHGFRDAMALIRQTPCYRLRYGGFDKLPADFAQQLQAILAKTA